MVVFECEKCNESLKKPKVASHLQHCRSNWVICIDCCKKFSWDDFETHTTCISEAQKYQGNLFVEKTSTNKGLKKQTSWIDNIKQKIEDPGANIEPRIKGLLERLVGFDNIPRKQKAFANFVKNSLKIWDENTIGKIWDVINVEIAAPKGVDAGQVANVGAGAAAPAAASKAKDSAASTAAKKSGEWAGWKRALDDELTSAGGKVPWKRLRESLVAHSVACRGLNGVSREELGNEAIASIPDAYLSKTDEFVRLPTATP
eukprot:TRINITY_DN48994_c0_g1_i1.p1 TRINITY_DN48994_c0_g1~~TRINITY_DN48994_c0_g1_i1.p1  ORF type:complete len:259 (+),score=59.01 TRINITY_DN48994_c0_g1_i1:133-909(+)